MKERPYLGAFRCEDVKIGFVESLFAVLRKYKKFTATQRTKLEQIYEDRCE